MSGNRDDDEDGENGNSSFMSQNFPDANPLLQNKQAKEPVKRSPSVQKSLASGPAHELAPLRVAGNSTINANDELHYQGNGVQNRLMRQLKQGRITVENRLDLHGQTIEQAYQSMMQFIHRCQQHGKHCVLIIHGQGYRSAGGVPVLKQNIDYWLRQHDSVLAFHSATPGDGGKGAVYVLLRKKPA